MALLGAIADDLTGATDLCNTLVRGGMRTVQTVGLPAADLDIPEADAIVVSLKSRTIPAAEATAVSVAAARRLRAMGVRQFFFKYCSTFDSTDAGNIGQVADALRRELATPFTIACPAFPENRRTTYLGHLFVGDRLLSDSPMRHHPLTPMTDPDLVRVLGRQSADRVGLVPYDVVRSGPDAIRRSFADLTEQRIGSAIVDALEDRHLRDIGAAAADLVLVTGGSGLALGLPDNFRRAGLLPERSAVDELPACGGLGAVLAGSCSQATRRQIETFAHTRPSFFLDPRALVANPEATIAEATTWACRNVAKGPVLVYSSETPDRVEAAQAAFGREAIGAAVEAALAKIAVALHAQGTRRLVIAGGETAGAVVQALGVTALRIGAQIAPGVPRTVSIGPDPIALVLKSGNFGGPDFFARALEAID